MALGPGKYDDLCTAARMMGRAESVVVIVLNGERGSGFSVQTTDPDFHRKLPRLLRDTADQIEASMRR